MTTEPRLVPSQLRLLGHLARGRRSKEIAAAIGSSRTTVDQSISTLRRRLGAHTNAEAVAIALGRGLIEVEPAPSSTEANP